MRKLYAAIFMALAALLAVPASAQIKFGLKGGLDVTHMSLNHDLLDQDNRTGFYIGPTVKLTLLDTGFGLDVSALYDQRSAKVTVDYGYEQITRDDYTVTQKQFAIPINLRYAIGLGDAANIFFFAGPQFGFNVGGDKDDINWKWKDSNFSVNVGMGFTVLSHLQINANYNIACGKTSEMKASELVHDVNSNVHSRFNAWQIGLAYYF